MCIRDSNTLLKNALGKKNYKIIQDEPQYWTAELKQNPVSYTHLDVYKRQT